MVKKKSLVWQNCSEETLGRHVREWLKLTDISRSIIFLEGEMGSGKSTLVREILRILSPDSISQGSPTFPLVQIYETKNGMPFYHVDLYRLRNEDELADSGIESQIEDPNSICCVEWASLFPNAFAHWFDESLPQKKKIFLIKINSRGDDARDYEISVY